MSLCSECVNGALSQSGVYCMEFKEEIVDEGYADDCSSFVPILVLAPVSALFDSNLRVKPTGWVSPEQERSVALELAVDYFGKEEHADRLIADLERKLGLILGQKFRLKRVG